MVDAITSYNANKPTNPKKDLTINWNKLTVKEIKEYEGEGQEVPEYIKKWADYIEHLQSVPDDVTYATYFNGNAESITSSRMGDYATYMLNNGIDPSSATQGQVYQKLCQDTITNIKNVTDQLNEIMKRAEKEVSEAEKSKDGICDRIQTLQQRIQTLKDDKKDPFAPMEIIEINQQIKAAGESGVTTMDMRLLSVQNIGADVADAYDLISGANSLADTATSMSRSTSISSTLTLMKYSKELKELSKEKKRDLKSAVEQQEGNVTTVEGYKSSVASTANQYIPPGAESETGNSSSINDSSNGESGSSASIKNDEKTAANKTKQAQASKKTKEEKSKTLADEKILTDPNEILKRKQKRGEA